MTPSKSVFATACLASMLMFGMFVACGKDSDDDAAAEPTPTPTAAAEAKPLTLNLQADCNGKPCF